MPTDDGARSSVGPAWANWIEDDDEPHLVVGVMCRECRASITGFSPMSPNETDGIWTNLDHNDGCSVGGVWERLYAHPQRITRGMAEKDTVYPAIHCIYRLRDDGKYERLCDSNFIGNSAPEVRDTPPFDVPPISEGWDDLNLLGQSYSCSRCARVAHELSASSNRSEDQDAE